MHSDSSKSLLAYWAYGGLLLVLALGLIAALPEFAFREHLARLWVALVLLMGQPAMFMFRYVKSVLAALPVMAGGTLSMLHVAYGALAYSPAHPLSTVWAILSVFVYAALAWTAGSIISKVAGVRIAFRAPGTPRA